VDFAILSKFADWASFFEYFVNFQISLYSYGAAAAAFSILTGLLVTVWRNRVRGSLLTVACLLSAVWAGVLAYSGTQADVPFSRILLTEMAHDSIWLIFLSSLLGGSVATKSNWLVRRGGVVLGLAFLASGLLLEYAGLKTLFPSAMRQILVMGSIVTSLYALVGVEQLYRNARPAQRNGLKFLSLGLAGIFAYDIFLYSNAVFDGQIQATFWDVRGFVVTLCVPLIAISILRISSWERGIFASRQIIFYTTTLFAAGLYLSLVGLAGYYIQTLGKAWGDVLQLLFFSAAILGLFALVLSEQLRGKIRVFIIKHFFERKYDYRAEWLRLSHTLTSTEDSLPLKKRAVKALAQIVGSTSGHLWLKDEDSASFTAVAGWDTQPIAVSVAADSGLPAFMAEKGWIVDVGEVASGANKYASLTHQDLPEGIATSAYVIPLMHESELMGFVSLSNPKTPVSLNFEDHDLLKTARQQIASYLAQTEATELLAESRQFEAYNRFTAFVMHDLKNAIAQQSLVVENAERHKRNPEFIDDSMETIKGSVVRMRRVLEHLKQGTVYPVMERVDVTKMVLRAEMQCSDREPVPTVTVPESSGFVKANSDRLMSSLTHAIRNAQDACEQGDSVTVAIEFADGECRFVIADTGCGMDPAFVRDRLFRPFDSTKGASGMGIGAYQIRETARASGGDVEVISGVGAGTKVIMRLPLIVDKDK
jgi:putative PEP-CTERM system histidine kinase